MKCCLCGKEAGKWGNSIWPISINEDNRCCDECNRAYVIPARLIPSVGIALKEKFERGEKFE